MKFDIVLAIVYLRKMIKVILLGSGNVATHLFQAFSKANGVEVVQVFQEQYQKIFQKRCRLQIIKKLKLLMYTLFVFLIALYQVFQVNYHLKIG